MTQEEFIKVLKKERIKFTKEGETIVVSKENKHVWLNSLQTLPRGMRFENGGSVLLNSLQTLPKEGMRFENNGSVWLNSKATRFNPFFQNKGNIYLTSYHNKVNGNPQWQDQHGIKLVFEK